MSILVEDVSKQFGSFRALDHVNLEVNSGSLVALVGPSGSGKSTLLRMIAGLDVPDEGKIWLSGKDATYAPIQQRNLGFVFQNYALFKHLTVFDNIAFGLQVRQASETQIRHRVQDLLQLIQLEHLADRYPVQLSGGQRQRIALARALAVEPKVLLLDEPFGALDASVRKELRGWLRHLHEEMPVTTVFVTHDQQEAMEVAHEMVVFQAGQIEQVGSPQEIYDNPATPFVRSFMGHVNPLEIQSEKLFLRPHDFLLEVKPLPGYWAAQIVSLSYGGTFLKVEFYLPQLKREVRIHISRQEFYLLQARQAGILGVGSTLYVTPRPQPTAAVRAYAI